MNVLCISYSSAIPPKGWKNDIVNNQGMGGIVNNRIKKELKMKMLIFRGWAKLGVMGAMADEYGTRGAVVIYLALPLV